MGEGGSVGGSKQGRLGTKLGLVVGKRSWDISTFYYFAQEKEKQVNYLFILSILLFTSTLINSFVCFLRYEYKKQDTKSHVAAVYY